ncbi:MAG: hypothetical protein DRH43_00150 [Deltaproteobacteria bacterium]|nr:MAG: hypothetical protein DRH43_00150 [Deltaproteobacteria bacterium]
MFLRPVEHVRRLAGLEAAFPLVRLPVPDKKPDGIFLRVDENAGAATALLLLEQIVQVVLQGDQCLCGGILECRDRRSLGLEVFERAGTGQVLLGVLTLEKVPVMEPDLDGDIGGRRVGVAVQVMPFRSASCSSSSMPSGVAISWMKYNASANSLGVSLSGVMKTWTIPS